MHGAIQHTLPIEGVLRDPSFSRNKRVSLHRWVPWVAGFSAEFVQDCLRKYGGDTKPGKTWVLDPFAGVGTTLVEAFLQGRNVVGFEINPYAALAARTKLEATKVSEQRFSSHIDKFELFYRRRIEKGSSSHIPDSSAPAGFKGRTQLFSPKVERKVLVSLDFINSIVEKRIRDLFRIALGSVMVGFSNYSYEPSLTRRVSVGKSEILDADVGKVLIEKLRSMLEDIIWMKDQVASLRAMPRGEFYANSIFQAKKELKRKNFIDMVVTSPPYLNNYHYPRNTRPQVHWLSLGNGNGYGSAREDESFGKFWQTVRDCPPIFLEFHLSSLNRKIEAIRALNSNRQQYGGAGWANYAATYFNDAFRFCNLLTDLLKRNGVAIIVLGNSVIQGVEIKTDQFFGQIAEICGLEFEETILLRKKRTGSSIIKSSVRVDAAPEKVVLYESAIVLRKKA